MPKSDIRDIRSRHMGEPQNRVMSIRDARAVDGDDRSVELAFSSEEPYERWFGVEILDHSPGSVRLHRLNAGGQVQLDHSWSLKDTVARVESARIDSDRVGRAVVRFGRSELAEQMLTDVRDRIIGNVSVGYIVHEMKLEESTDENDFYRVTDFEPLELSLVAIPADTTVGVGRDYQTSATSAVSPPKPESNTMPEENRAGIDTPVEEPQTPTVEEPTAEQRTATAEPVAPERTAADARIREIGARFAMKDEAEDYIQLGSSVKEFQDAVRAAQVDRLRPVPSAPRVQVQIPRRRSRLRAFPNTRDGEEAAFRAGMWAQAVVYGNEQAARWCNDYGVRVMTGSTSGTSAIVPDEMVLPIIDLREEYGIARQACYVHQMGSDTATVPRRKSGVTAYFVNRTDATTASDAAFDDVQLVAREVAALTRLSRSYVADAAIDLGDHLASEMAYAFAVKEDDCLFNGDGTSTYGGIYGIRPKIIDGNHTAGAIDAASGHDTFAELDHDDLVGVTGALPMFPGINPSWYISKRGNALVFDALKVAGGGNNIGNLGERPQLAYLGDPIAISQSMPTSTGDLSNVAMLVYGDLNMGVTFGDRQGFEVEILRERYAEYRQIGVQAVERFDIVAHGLGDTSNAGPVVALIGE